MIIFFACLLSTHPSSLLFLMVLKLIFPPSCPDQSIFHDDLRDKFEKLSEMEKDESKEVFCDIYCNRGYDSHRCSEETNELFIGCDMKNITDVFENEDDLEEEPVTYFPCKVCDNMFDAHEKLNTHFKESHTPDKSVKCSLNQCEFASKKINVLIKHIGVNHLDIVLQLGILLSFT